MNKKEIFWEITKSERKSRMIKLFFFSLSLAGPVLIFMVIERALTGYEAENPWVIISILVVLAVFSFLFTYFFPYKKRSYKLNDRGILVTKGGDIGRFDWDEFNFFANSPNDGVDSLFTTAHELVTANKIRQIKGRTIFLVMEKKGFSSNQVLVIYTEPDNYDEVYNFIKEKLEERVIVGLGFSKLLFK